MPVLVEHVAEAQVGDAGAADLPEPRERRAVAADAEQHVDPVAAALERRAVVRRAEADQRAQLRAPARGPRLAVVARAARDEPAHAVTERARARRRGTGHAATSRSSSAASSRPFVEMWRPLL